ncbi:hypothetical protein JTB14_024452 [Gonioctena quinquepunctata]|nr:hypothetical protein JTB14_024452 [Gonioctena quinquepunctata]
MKILLYSLLLFPIFKFCEPACEDKWPKCHKGQNVVCERGGYCGSRGSCKIMGLDEKYRTWILDEHNKLRSKVASGQETRGGNEAAANMMALSYDVELEHTAICNVNQCEMKHDLCRGTLKFPSAGQNLYSAGGSMDFDSETALRKAINAWYEEVKYTTKDIVTSFVSQIDPAIGHYTQMVWAETTRVGCARARTGDSYYLACNYGIAGNMREAPVYERGPPCSKCPAGVACNTKYPGLCGEVDEAELKKAPLKGSRLVCSNLVSFGMPLVLISLKTFGKWVVL